MVLSEAEAEAQLAALRRQREMLDRTITDLTLYLELGRRLRAGSEGAANHTTQAASITVPKETSDSAAPIGMEDRETLHARASGNHGRFADRMSLAESNPVLSGSQPRSAAGPSTGPSSRETAMDTAETGALDHGSSDGLLSDGVLARRYGRALIEAALAVLEEAGRPLHASEILAALASRGFSLPGHDPVAALNTRLWKRSGAGGPLKRLGDAVYALADEEG